jgi:hypothetical protein
MNKDPNILEPPIKTPIVPIEPTTPPPTPLQPITQKKATEQPKILTYRALPHTRRGVVTDFFREKVFSLPKDEPAPIIGGVKYEPKPFFIFETNENGFDFEFLGAIDNPSPLCDKTEALAAVQKYITTQNEAWATYWKRFEQFNASNKKPHLEKPLPIFDDFLELQDCYPVFHSQFEGHILYWQVNYRIMLPSVRIDKKTYHAAVQGEYVHIGIYNDRAARTMNFRHFAVEEIGREPYFFAPKITVTETVVQATADYNVAVKSVKIVAPPTIVTTTEVVDQFGHEGLFYRLNGDCFAPYLTTADGALAASKSGIITSEDWIFTGNEMLEKTPAPPINDSVNQRGIDFYIALAPKDKHNKQFNIRYQTTQHLKKVGYRKGKGKAGDRADVAVIVDPFDVAKVSNNAPDTEIKDNELRGQYFTLPPKGISEKLGRDGIFSYLRSPKNNEDKPFLDDKENILNTRFEHSIFWEYEMGGTGLRYKNKAGEIIHFHLRAKDSPNNYGKFNQVTISPSEIDETQESGQKFLKEMYDETKRTIISEGKPLEYADITPYKDKNGNYSKISVTSNGYKEHIDYYWHSHFGVNQLSIPSATDLKAIRADANIFNNFQINLGTKTVALFRGKADVIDGSNMITDRPANDYYVLVVPVSWFESVIAVAIV